MSNYLKFLKSLSLNLFSWIIIESKIYTPKYLIKMLIILLIYKNNIVIKTIKSNSLSLDL